MATSSEETAVESAESAETSHGLATALATAAPPAEEDGVGQRILELKAENLTFSSEVRSLQRRLAEVRAHRGGAATPDPQASVVAAAANGDSAGSAAAGETSSLPSEGSANAASRVPPAPPSTGHRELPAAATVSESAVRASTFLELPPTEGASLGKASHERLPQLGDGVGADSSATSGSTTFTNTVDATSATSSRRYCSTADGDWQSRLAKQPLTTSQEQPQHWSQQVQEQQQPASQHQRLRQQELLNGPRQMPGPSLVQNDIDQLKTENNRLTEQLVESSLESALHVESLSNDRNTLWRFANELRQQVQLEQAERARCNAMLTSTQETLKKLVEENVQLSETVGSSASLKVMEAQCTAYQNEANHYRLESEQLSQECEQLRQHVRQQTDQANATILELAQRNLELQEQLQDALSRLQQQALPNPPTQRSNSTAATASDVAEVPPLGEAMVNVESPVHTLHTALNPHAAQALVHIQPRTQAVRSGGGVTPAVPQMLSLPTVACLGVDFSPAPSALASPHGAAPSRVEADLSPARHRRTKSRQPPSMPIDPPLMPGLSMLSSASSSSVTAAMNPAISSGCPCNGHRDLSLSSSSVSAGGTLRAAASSPPRSPFVGIDGRYTGRGVASVTAPCTGSSRTALSRTDQLQRSLDIMSTEIGRIQQKALSAAQ